MNTASPAVSVSDLEALAQELADATGEPIGVCRDALRFEVARLSVAMGLKTLDEVNIYLAPHGMKIVRRAAVTT